MTQPRSMLVSLQDTPWYHCVVRCVRRAFLCGEDALTGQNFDHRRGRIAVRLKEMAAVFAIDIAAYAVMSNHYHVVLRVDQARALSWSVEEVLTRWTQLFSGPLLVQRYLSPARAGMHKAEIDRVEEYAACFRAGLHDLSWFMGRVNESLARQANREDGCTGRFWEGRFKSQALLGEPAVIAAMAYVDLNPVRAGMAKTPETSDYTSVQERLSGMAAVLPADTTAPDNDTAVIARAPLLPFDPSGRMANAIPFAFADYLELVDWTGRAVHPDKKGHIATTQPRILARIGIEGAAFITSAMQLFRGRAGASAVGSPAALRILCTRRRIKYLRGGERARVVFEPRRVPPTYTASA